jgi:alginate O-acetyltransferase complex protein AlgI
MATFFVSGLWHGASWSFVLWGTLHGAFSVLDRLFERQLSRLPGALRTACTFLTVNLLWVLFRAETLGDALKVYKGLFDFRNINAGQLQEIVFDDIIVFPLPISIANVTFWLSACSLMVFCRKNSIGMRNDFQKTTKTAIATAFLFLVAIIHLSRTSPFIYFNF